ncbi:MAG: molybdenum cofactor biosynthesis protein MoaE [Planctomycetota bacterium]|nr:molybdenum cofactor biosynthesis protein MoaE [Planctomycetota bacterium]
MKDNAPIIDLALVNTPVLPQTWTPFPPGGAECTFLGITRPETHAQHGPLIALDYEAHEVMAREILEQLAKQTLHQWSPLAIRIHHALGPVRVGEASVVIQVVCLHRAEAFEACRWLIDELKTRVPIWKRETWEAGSSWSKGTSLAAGLDLGIA